MVPDRTDRRARLGEGRVGSGTDAGSGVDFGRFALCDLLLDQKERFLPWRRRTT
jgi:hypothetical protein